MRRIPLTLAVLVAGLALAGCATASPAPSAPAASATATTEQAAAEASGSPEADPMTEGAGADTATAGAYLTYEQYESQAADRAGTAVVYFFHADWCPSCRATEESLTTAGVPDGLTVVKIDYDTATDLKRQYGITQQHTFVQVDDAGGELATWTGSITGDEIQAQATHG